VLAVDVRDVAIRMLFDLLMREIDQLRSLFECQCLLRAGLDARGLLAFAGARDAEFALSYARRQCIAVLIRGDLERARHHAIAAADAFPRVVGDRAVLLLLKRADDASGNARGVIAMQAVDLGEDGLAAVGMCAVTAARCGHDGKRIRRRPTRLPAGGLIVIARQRARIDAICLLARMLAQPAADALRDIDEHANSVFADERPV